MLFRSQLSMNIDLNDFIENYLNSYVEYYKLIEQYYDQINWDESIYIIAQNITEYLQEINISDFLIDIIKHKKMLIFKINNIYLSCLFLVAHTVKDFTFNFFLNLYIKFFLDIHLPPTTVFCIKYLAIPLIE